MIGNHGSSLSCSGYRDFFHFYILLLGLKKKKSINHLRAGSVTEAGTQHPCLPMATYVTQMHCVHAGSGEIRVVWDWGVPMQGVCVSQPVQALRARQNSHGRAEVELSLLPSPGPSHQLCEAEFSTVL